MGITDEEQVAELMKRVEANDAGAIEMLGNHYEHGLRRGFQQDQAKAIKFYSRAADLGCSKAHHHLAGVYRKGGDLKKAKFHYEAAAMAGDETSRYTLGIMEANSGNIERAVKHLRIAASAGHYNAMHHLKTGFEGGHVSRESINSTLVAYNNSCAEVRSEARDAYLRTFLE
jgi:TPR repeat protein